MCQLCTNHDNEIMNIDRFQFFTMETYWPPSHLDAAKLVRAAAKPNEQWMRYTVRIMGSSGMVKILMSLFFYF